QGRSQILLALAIRLVTGQTDSLVLELALAELPLVRLGEQVDSFLTQSYVEELGEGLLLGLIDDAGLAGPFQGGEFLHRHRLEALDLAASQESLDDSLTEGGIRGLVGEALQQVGGQRDAALLHGGPGEDSELARLRQQG